MLHREEFVPICPSCQLSSITRPQPGSRVGRPVSGAPPGSLRRADCEGVASQRAQLAEPRLAVRLLHGGFLCRSWIAGDDPRWLGGRSISGLRRRRAPPDADLVFRQRWKSFLAPKAIQHLVNPEAASFRPGHRGRVHPGFRSGQRATGADGELIRSRAGPVENQSAAHGSSRATGEVPSLRPLVKPEGDVPWHCRR